MSENIIVPALGESITEATVSQWLKNQGDTVKLDEPIVELETDKVNVEVPSPAEGVISKINFAKGDTVEVGALLGIVSSQGEKIVPINKTTTQKKAIVSNKKTKEILTNVKKKISVFDEKKFKNNKTEIQQPLILEQPLILKEEVSNNNKSSEINNLSNTLSPAVRKIVQEKKIDVTDIQGTGKGGRILKGDVIALMSQAPEPSERKIKYGSEEVIRMTRLRLTIAKRLKEAQENAAMLTTFNEVDMSNINQMRKDYKEDFEKKFSIKLGFMSFFVKACIAALKNYPAINAEIQNEEIVYKNYYNISFAVGTDKGLVVPVLRDSDEMSFADIERSITFLGEKARNGKITISDLQGGTFTITNGGIYGSMLSTPILNPPQSGVLGMHNIIERPVSVNGSVAIRPMMYLALSYDHRIVDGKEAVSFLKNIKDLLEDPRRLFLNV